MARDFLKFLALLLLTAKKERPNDGWNWSTLNSCCFLQLYFVCSAQRVNGQKLTFSLFNQPVYVHSEFDSSTSIESSL